MKHRMTHYLLLMLGVVWGVGCTRPTDEVYLSKVVDLKGESKQTWELKYDDKGRLVQYGNTPIHYGSEKITVGKMDWNFKGGGMYHADFYLERGQVSRCKSVCLLELPSGRVEALKHTYFHYAKDTLYIDSDYYLPDRRLVRSLHAQYIYDKKNRLTEVISVCKDEKGEESACHSYYGYNTNIHYTSNLNLQAYIVDREGLDTFFFFLLNLGCKEPCGALPNHIRHCVNHGKATYVADGLYRLDGDVPVKAEVVSDQLELKARFEFEHLNNEVLDLLTN